MTLEVSSDDVLALVENIEEWFLLDENGLRRRVSRLRDRVRALESENARLRAELARVAAGAHAPDRESPTPRTVSDDPWAVPGEPVATAVAAEQSTSRPTVRFACGKCGELHAEADLRRIDGAFVCASCDAPAPDDPPVRRGSYR